MKSVYITSFGVVCSLDDFSKQQMKSADFVELVGRKHFTNRILIYHGLFFKDWIY